MDKWGYIEKIKSYPCNKYEDKILEMLDKYNRVNLQEITFEEVVEFYNFKEIKL